MSLWRRTQKPEKPWCGAEARGASVPLPPGTILYVGHPADTEGKEGDQSASGQLATMSSDDEVIDLESEVMEQENEGTVSLHAGSAPSRPGSSRPSRRAALAAQERIQQVGKKNPDEYGSDQELSESEDGEEGATSDNDGSSNAGDEIDGASAPLSAYELQRLQSIEGNNAKLRELGLLEEAPAPAARHPAATPKTKHSRPGPSAAPRPRRARLPASSTALDANAKVVARDFFELLAGDTAGRMITVRDLKRVSTEMRLGLASADLADMIQLFDGSAKGGLDLDEFVGVVQMTGEVTA